MAERRRCMLMRLLTPRAVCVRLEDTGAIVLAELAEPFSPRSMVKAQGVHAFAPVRAEVVLGRYHVGRHAFTECLIEAELPETAYQRVGYAKSAAKRKAESPVGDPMPDPGASDARPRHSGPGQDAPGGSGPTPSG